MTDKEILQKVFNIAYGNGWDYNCSVAWESEYFVPITKDKRYYKIIFSHEFVKAFFGEKKEAFWEEWKDYTDSFEAAHGCQAEWKHHLQQMVLEKEPLKYLEKFL